MTKLKRIITFVLVFVMVLCTLPMSNVYAAKGDLGEGYNVNNIDFTFTTVDGEKISSNSNGKVKVIVFARTNGNCYNSNEVIKDICGIGWSTSPDIDTLIVDIDSRDSESVKNSSLAYDPWIVKFCYDESSSANNLMWSYLNTTIGNVNSITLPVVVIIDKNNKVQYLKNGYISAKELYNYIEPLLYGEEIEDEEEVVVGKEQIKIYSNGFYDYDSAEEVFRLTNEARVSEGKAKLVMDEKLTEIAMHRAAEQALLYNHIRPNGTKWYTLLTGKYLNGAGENIAYGQNSAQIVTTAWLNSEGHRANIMNGAYTSIGVGSFTHNGIRFWVQIFSAYSEATYVDKSGVSKDVVLDAYTPNVGEFEMWAYDSRLKTGESTSVNMRISNLASGNLKLNVKADNVSFKSSDVSIVSVDKYGNITAIAPGKAKITAILDETLVAKCDITVEAGEISDDGLTGDVNADGVANATDALMVLKHAAKLETLSDDEQIRAELNNDGAINANDALQILKIAAKLI